MFMRKLLDSPAVLKRFIVFFFGFFFKRSVFFACEILISESSECIYRWYLDSQIVGRDTHSSKQRVEEFTF